MWMNATKIVAMEFHKLKKKSILFIPCKETSALNNNS